MQNVGNEYVTFVNIYFVCLLICCLLTAGCQ